MADSPPPIPDFVLLRRIGRGAYGEVWLARSVTGIYRAVKIVYRERFDEARPFEREFAGIQQFEAVSVGHESQVSLLHVGRNDAEGFFYYVMELADDVETGEEIFPERYVPKTLKELRARRVRLSAVESLDISIALTRALAHLHAHNLVHRDIKPSNVIFVHGVPKLADIGLVSAIDSSHSFVGTEGFVPPEGPGTTAADVFSLGKVVYEISTGRDRHDFPKLPENFDSLPDKHELLELNEVVLKACEQDLHRRYTSAEAMREELLLLQAEKSVRRLHLMERRFAFVAKFGAAAAAVTALAVAGFLWASAQTRQTKQNLQRAELAESNALTRLHQANLNWVRANRLTGRPGQRFAGLAELTRTAAHTNRLDLRNEAIACLALPDVRPLRTFAKTPGWPTFNFSPSFRLYSTNDDHGNLTVRDTTTDEVKYRLPTQGASLSPKLTRLDDRFVATGDVKGRAWLWDLHSQTPRPIQLPPGSTALEFTPDGRTLVVKAPDSSLHFLDTTNGASRRSFPAPQISWLTFNQTGDFFLTRSPNGHQVIIHRTADGQPTCVITPPTNSSCVAWHPDGRHIALAWMTKFGLWDARTGHQLCVFEAHEATIVGLAFTAVGEWVASTSWDNSTVLWQTDTAGEVLRLSGGGNWLRWSADGSRLTFQSWDHTQVCLYEFAEPGVVHRFTVPPPTRAFHWLAQVAFSPDGELIAALDSNEVLLFQPPHLAPLARLPAAKSYTVQFAADGHSLFLSGADGLQRWPMTWSSNRTELHLGPPHVLDPTRGQHVVGFNVSRAGDWLLAGANGKLFAFDPRQSGGARIVPSISSRHVPCLSADGHLAAGFTGRGHELHVWNARTGTLMTNFPINRGYDIAFTPDNRWLACSDNDVTMLWRTADWVLQHRFLHRHDAPGRYRVAFSPDSRLAALNLSEHEMRLILLETGEELATLPVDRMLNSLAFSPDGTRLAAASEAGYFRLWDLRRLRSELAAMNLDWHGPPLPNRAPASKPINVRLVARASPNGGTTVQE